MYTKRLSYGFAPTSSTRLAASVPATAENLLRTTYPSLSPAQRRQILAQTEIAFGHPLDTTAAHRAYALVPDPAIGNVHVDALQCLRRASDG